MDVIAIWSSDRAAVLDGMIPVIRSVSRDNVGQQQGVVLYADHVRASWDCEFVAGRRLAGLGHAAFRALCGMFWTSRTADDDGNQGRQRHANLSPRRGKSVSRARVTIE